MVLVYIRIDGCWFKLDDFYDAIQVTPYRGFESLQSWPLMAECVNFTFFGLKALVFCSM